MSTLFSAISFSALIAAAVFGIVWIVKKIRHRPTKAHIACIVTALVAVAGFVAFGLTYEPPEKIEEPQTISTEADAEKPEETPATPAETPQVAEEPEMPTENPVETPTEPSQTTQEPEEVTTPPPTTEPSEEPTEAAEPTPEAIPTEEPVEEPKPPDPVEEIDPVELDKKEIEAAAREIVAANYTATDVTRVTVNENYGTDADGDYVLLVYVTWNIKNSADMTKRMLAMYSEDFAARVGTEIPKVNDFAVFWMVPYYSETDTAAKYSYERVGDGMTETDHNVTIK